MLGFSQRQEIGAFTYGAKLSALFVCQTNRKCILCGIRCSMKWLRYKFEEKKIPCIYAGVYSSSNHNDPCALICAYKMFGEKSAISNRYKMCNKRTQAAHVCLKQRCHKSCLSPNLCEIKILRWKFGKNKTHGNTHLFGEKRICKQSQAFNVYESNRIIVWSMCDVFLT